MQSASAADDIGPFFSISLLGPATFHMGSYAAELEDQLALIGINVSYVDLTTWSGLFDRTYDYPGPYPVPTYSEGGFDILLSTMSSGGFEFRSEIYSSDAIIPVGYNVYQYNSTEYDSAATNLANSFLIEDRLTYIKEIQGIVHNDLPSIPIVHLMDNYVFDENLTNWNADLWNINYQLMENWTIPDQSEFRYAMHSEIGTFHPYQSYESYELQILRQIYPGLVEMHSDTKELLPYIAESYSTSGRSWCYYR